MLSLSSHFTRIPWHTVQRKQCHPAQHQDQHYFLQPPAIDAERSSTEVHPNLGRCSQSFYRGQQGMKEEMEEDHTDWDSQVRWNRLRTGRRQGGE